MGFNGDLSQLGISWDLNIIWWVNIIWWNVTGIPYQLNEDFMDLKGIFPTSTSPIWLITDQNRDTPNGPIIQVMDDHIWYWNPGFWATTILGHHLINNGQDRIYLSWGHEMIWIYSIVSQLLHSFVLLGNSIRYHGEIDAKFLGIFFGTHI